MGMMYASSKSKVKAKKKPGWKKDQEEYEAWLNKWKKPEDKKTKVQPLQYSLSGGTRPTRIVESKITPTVQEKVLAPQVKYKENPDMLERELKARERKFTTAPIYNKGPDQLFTDEMMKELSAGTLRRR